MKTNKLISMAKVREIMATILVADVATISGWMLLALYQDYITKQKFVTRSKTT